MLFTGLLVYWLITGLLSSRRDDVIAYITMP